MGVVQVTATVRNPGVLERSWDGLFLVDTGSTDCVVPASALRSIGLEPRGRRSYELADGRREEVDIAVAEIEFMGEVVGATVRFGAEGVAPILGVTAWSPPPNRRKSLILLAFSESAASCHNALS